MDFVNRNFSGAVRILLSILAVFVFIKILPLLVIAGFILWAGFKGFKYFKTKGNKKAKKHENVDISANINNNRVPFDFTGKNIVDVEYEEIKK